MKRQTRSAFSLIELLVVVAIISILAVLALPAFNSINSGRFIEQAGQKISDQIALARQIALSKNRSVEVWLMKIPTEPTGNMAYAAIQLSEVSDDGSDRPLGKVVKLPQGIIISEDLQLSSLFSSSAMGTLDKNSISNLPGSVKPDEVRFFRFKPNGQTDLSNMAEKYYLTVHNQRDVGKTPANFSTIQIDPMSGRVRILRP
jgi:uncharacterized protein (TIGR02596 family)